MITEDHLEQLSLSWFADNGWQTVHDPEQQGASHAA